MAFFQAVTVGADIAVAFGVFYSAENYFAEWAERQNPKKNKRKDTKTYKQNIN